MPNAGYEYSRMRNATGLCGGISDISKYQWISVLILVFRVLAVWLIVRRSMAGLGENSTGMKQNFNQLTYI